MRLVLCACLAILATTSLSGQLRFLNAGSDWSSQPPVVATDAVGNTYVVSISVTDSNGNSSGLTATKRDASNAIVYSFAFAPQQDAGPLAAVVDAQGNLYVGGWTDSPSFPQINALMHPTLVPFINGRTPGMGFLVKIDAAGDRLLFSTLVGGNDATVPFAVHLFGYSTAVNAIAVDGAGNVYAAGATRSPTFPVSSNAFQKTGGGLSDPTQTDNSDVRTSGFLVKISSAGDAVLYSTYLGGQTRVCEFATSTACAATVINAIAVDDQSRATVAGLTLQPDFPVTTGAFQTDCHCDYGHNSPFVSRFRADGGGLEWSTFLGSYDGYPGNVPAVVGLALDAQGNATVAGSTYRAAFPTTSDAIQQNCPVVPKGPGSLTPAGFLSVISSDGSSLLHSTYFGGSQGSTPRSMTRDSDGNLWITGVTSSDDLQKPVNSPDLGLNYAAELDASLSHVVRFYGLPTGSAGLTINALPQHRVVVAGTSNDLVMLSGDDAPAPSVWGVAGSAEPAVSRYLAPGALVSLYGSHLGPLLAVGAQLDAAGKVATELGGSRVLVNGIAAPMLYAGGSQINFVMPFETANSPDAVIQVMTPAGQSEMVTGISVVPYRPEIFPVFLNQDGTINSQEHPAPRGSVVTFWASGGGAMDQGNVDGVVNTTPLGQLLPPVGVGLGRLTPHDMGDVTYAGAAPGSVAGVIQVNFRVPEAHTGHGSCHFSCPVTLVLGYTATLQPDPLLWVLE